MKISANYYSVTPPRFIAGTKGSYGIEKLEIVFSGEWDGLSKKIVFYPPDSAPVGVIYSHSPIDIPIEVMRTRGRSKYAVIGYKDEKKLVSVSGEIDVLGTLDDTDNSAILPTPDEMAQVLNLMQKAIDEARSLREDAQNGVFDGKDGNRWHIGSAVFGTSDRIECEVEGAFADDLYLNIDSYDIYIAVSDGIWKYIGNIKGTGGSASGSGSLDVESAEIDSTTGMLIMTVSDTYGSTTFGINTNGYLEVNINE